MLAQNIRAKCSKRRKKKKKKKSSQALQHRSSEVQKGSDFDAYKEYQDSLQDSLNRALKRSGVALPGTEGPLASIFEDEADTFPRLTIPNEQTEPGMDLKPGEAVAAWLQNDEAKFYGASNCIRARP